MSLKNKFVPVIAAASLGVAASTVPVAAQAEMSASFAASNFYLWRGIDLSNGSGAVSGSLDYAHDSGFYAGVWASSEGAAGATHEYDLYAGFAGEMGDFGYDVSLWAYEYPSVAGATSYSDFSELIIGLSYADASFTLYKSLQTTGTNSAGDTDETGGYVYWSLGYTYEKIGATLGGWMWEEDDPVDGDYIHLDISYAANDEITFVFSQIVEDADLEDSDFLVNVTWAKSWDL